MQHIIFCHICLAQYPESYCKRSCCGCFEAKYTKRYQNHSPKSYNEHPHHFYLGVTVHLGFSFQRRQCSLMASTWDSGSSSPSLCAHQDCWATLCNILFSQCLSLRQEKDLLTFSTIINILLVLLFYYCYKVQQDWFTSCFFSCRMANFCSKHLGLLAYQVVGEERLPFISTVLGNPWKQLIPAVTLDIPWPLILDLDSAW